MVSLTLIVAVTRSNGIGQGSRLPWRLPLEMKYFARITQAALPEHFNAVIMGRKTWESIPKSRRPLVGRINIVISNNLEYDLGCQSSLPSTVRPSLEAALTQVEKVHNALAPEGGVHRRFIIGGASIYKDALALEAISPTSPIVDRILLTRVLSPAFEECDVFFPDFSESEGWRQSSHEELEAWTGFEVARGVQSENGVEYEFQMWIRRRT